MHLLQLFLVVVNSAPAQHRLKLRVSMDAAVVASSLRFGMLFGSQRLFACWLLAVWEVAHSWCFMAAHLVPQLCVPMDMVPVQQQLAERAIVASQHVGVFVGPLVWLF